MELPVVLNKDSARSEQREEGIDPERELESSFKVINWVSRPSVAGRVPVILLLLISRYVR